MIIRYIGPLIKEYYERGKVEVINIEPYPDYGEHYYKVYGKSDEGEFTNIVCVQNGKVLVVPE